MPEPSVPKLQNTCGKHQDTVDACGFFRRSLFAFVVLTNTNDFSLETPPRSEEELAEELTETTEEEEKAAVSELDESTTEESASEENSKKSE